MDIFCLIWTDGNVHLWFGGEVLKILPPYHVNRHVVSCLYLDTWTFGLVDNKQR